MCCVNCCGTRYMISSIYMDRSATNSGTRQLCRAPRLLTLVAILAMGAMFLKPSCLQLSPLSPPLYIVTTVIDKESLAHSLYCVVNSLSLQSISSTFNINLVQLALCRLRKYSDATSTETNQSKERAHSDVDVLQATMVWSTRGSI